MNLRMDFLNYHHRRYIWTVEPVVRAVLEAAEQRKRAAARKPRTLRG